MGCSLCTQTKGGPGSIERKPNNNPNKEIDNLKVKMVEPTIQIQKIIRPTPKSIIIMKTKKKQLIIPQMEKLIKIMMVQRMKELIIKSHKYQKGIVLS